MYMSKELVTLRSLLKKYFRLVASYSKDIYSVDDGFSTRTEKEFREYRMYRFVDAIGESTKQITQLVSILDKFVKATILWFDFFFSLLNLFGTDKSLEIIRGEVRFESIVELENIDLGFLRYNVASNVSLAFPKIKELFSALLSELGELSRVLRFVKSEIVERLVGDLETVLREWLSRHDEFHNMFEEAIHAPPSETLNKLISVLNNLIDFARKFLKISKYMSPSGKGWEEYEFNDLLVIVDRFKKLQKDLRLLLDARKEAYEHALKCHELILTADWGDREKANRMFESFVRFEISVDKLIPREFSVEDLAFSLIAAKAELNITDQAAKLEKEKAYALREVSESLKSRIFKLLYHGILKRLAIGTRYLDQLFSILDELQRESKRILNSKA